MKASKLLDWLEKTVKTYGDYDVELMIDTEKAQYQYPLEDMAVSEKAGLIVLIYEK